MTNAIKRPDETRVWHPVASAADLVPGHIFQASLLGHQLAIWTADDGHINIWEDRCLHRGVQLSLGTVDGRELQCAYHGWRYASRTAGCTYIPAHPAGAPARTICNRVYPAVEHLGLIWTSNAASPDPAVLPDAFNLAAPGSVTPLRAIEIGADAATVTTALTEHIYWPSGHLDALEPDMTVISADPFTVVTKSATDRCDSTVAFFLQPINDENTVVRGLITDASAPVQVLRHHNRQLSKLRNAVEATHAPDRRLRVLPESQMSTQPASSAVTTVVVDQLELTASDIMRVELVGARGPLPTTQPGAHIDLHLPNGITRQYSLINPAGDQASYVLGVKLEPESAGGSSYIHAGLAVGDELALSGPHANFSLRRDATRSVLIAGGIGLTPLLAMARTLSHSDMAYELHLFTRHEQPPFLGELADLSDVETYTGLDPDQTIDAVSRLVAEHQPGDHLYVCGPIPLLEATRRLAAEAMWADEAIHFEYFSNPNELDAGSEFEVALARSALTFNVAAGTTLLEALRANGVALPSSCEQGACGTCVATVIEGEPLHQDVYLTNTERQAGDRIITCVSRSATRLTLDL